MADGRMLKKVVSQSRRLSELKTDSARLLYTWLIPHLDIKGRYSAEPCIIKGSIVPRIKSFTEEQIIDCLNDLSDKELIYLYEIDGDNYLELRKFTDHQTLNPSREAISKIPDPVKRKSLKKSTWDLLWNQWEQSDKKCPVCGKKAEFIPSKGFVFDGYIPLNIDHIVPISKGGSNDINNLRITCEKCNKSNGNNLENYQIEDDNSRATPEQLQSNSQVTPTQIKLIKDNLIKDKGTADAPVDKSFLLPSKEQIEESSDPMIMSQIEQICGQLYQEKIFSEVNAFKNSMLKKKKNPRAILHTLCRAYIKRDFEKGAWAYCQEIIEKESMNYNARDYQKTS